VAPAEPVAAAEPAEPVEPVTPVEPAAPAEPMAPAEPTHVDREATVVESLGPAEEPHATLQVDAPWDDYDDQAASAIVSRLREADEATKAVVRLYEQQRKNRRTVLRATE
jgi:hypothetical protein